MDYTKRLNMIEMFLEPPQYRPPVTAEELAGNVDYPNRNSHQYRMTRKPTDNVQYPFLDQAALNSNGLVIVAGNDLSGRHWGSSFYAWEQADQMVDEAKACFKRQCRYVITALKFTKDPNLFVLGNDKGSVEIWSTRNPARGEGYTLYMVDSQSEHIEGVSAMDILGSEESKLITGSNDGCLKVWNCAADLHSTTTMTLAHTDEITGISASNHDHSLFVTSSLDRSALLWDLREARPASALYDNHKFALTAIYWSTKTEANSVIALGDETGALHFVDTRQPNVFTHSVQVFDRKIHKVSFNGTNFAVLGNTNRVKFYNETLKLLHECSPAQNYLRDIIWEKCETDKQGACWLIGWDSFIERVEY